MKTNHHYVVSQMRKDEIPIAIAWAKQEGWNPGLHDEECFYQADPHGFFAGKLNGKIIVVGSGVIYDEQFAFFGLYITDPAYRGQGYGFEFTKAVHAYMGDRNVGMDGVVQMQAKYAKFGYKMAYNNARYNGVVPLDKLQQHAMVTPLSQVNFEQLKAYDRRHFPAAREAFLTCWINQPGGKSVGYVKQGQLLGYGVIRPCYEGFKIGPLFADNPSVADDLFLHLAHHATGQPIYLDIPECNPMAVDLVNRYQLKKVFETARMYLKDIPSININQIYGITTFELG